MASASCRAVPGGCRSGWCFRASFLYACFISAIEAFLLTLRIRYKSMLNTNKALTNYNFIYCILQEVAPFYYYLPLQYIATTTRVWALLPPQPFHHLRQYRTYFLCGLCWCAPLPCCCCCILWCAAAVLCRPGRWQLSQQHAIPFHILLVKQHFLIGLVLAMLGALFSQPSEEPCHHGEDGQPAVLRCKDVPQKVCSVHRRFLLFKVIPPCPEFS